MGGWKKEEEEEGEGDKNEKIKMNQVKDGLRRCNSGLARRASRGGCMEEHNTQTKSDKTMQPKLLINATLISTN